jgi:Protein of unknown function (DUF1634)
MRGPGDKVRAWDDERVQFLIGSLLRWGVALAAGVVLAGGILGLAENGARIINYGTFRGEPLDLRTVPGIVAQALALRPRGLMQLGVLLLLVHGLSKAVP